MEDSSLADRLMRPGLLRDAGVYAAFNGAAALFPLVVVPLLTRVVTPEDYGIYGIVLVTVTFVMPIIGAGLETAVGRRFVDRGESDFPRYVTTAIATVTVLALLVYGLALLSHSALETVFPLPASWYGAWVAIAWSQILLGIVLSLLQMEQKPVEYGTWRVGRASVVQLLAAVTAIAGFRDWRALVLSITLANLALTVSCIAWLRRRKYVVARTSGADAADALRYGAPLIPHMLGSAVLVAAAPFFVTNLVSLEAVGIYTVGAQLGQVMFMIASSVNRAWVPWYYARMKENTPAARRAVTKAGAGLSAGLIGIAVVGSVVGALLIPWVVGEAYRAAVPVFLWSVAAWTVHGLYGVVSASLFYTGRTAWISVASLLTISACVILNPILIAAYGMVGAAAATCLAYTVTLAAGTAMAVIFQRKGA